MSVRPVTIATAYCLFSLPSFSQRPIAIDLHDAVKKGDIQVYNRTLGLIEEAAHPGIRLSKDFGEGVAWLKGVEFSNGTIEFDVRGEDVKQHSFVGIAFHGANDSTFDAIYLRPFQFRATNDTLRNRSIQYISLPEYTWRVLRAQSPTVYEHSIDPSPDPNAWVHMRVVVQGETISTYINGAREPSLVVKKVTKLHSGRVGFYVADTSGGDFANLKITRRN
ncbi:MAG: family 16 glycoside hydrolase [Flavobacteriales bacterium]